MDAQKLARLLPPDSNFREEPKSTVHLLSQWLVWPEMALTAAVLPPLMAASCSLCHRQSSRQRNDRTKEASRSVPVLRVETAGNGEKSPDHEGGEAVEGDSLICATAIPICVRGGWNEVSGARLTDRHLALVEWWPEME
ncbi:hypothetical protein JCGZ_26637 [Jatropha curcas]|uniref:Uncharacterized protein n=1 Tax=Jatropha curcas TaxID=180498 RepID=A0A067JV71_JATCU|nr:hypothetical protein JCGZ_26637 [Jatropha curcas]